MRPRICGKKALGQAGLAIKDICSFHPYDDFIIAIMLQMEAFGFCKPGQGSLSSATTISPSTAICRSTPAAARSRRARPACSAHNLVEAVRQLRGEAGKRQVKKTDNALVTGIGWINYGRNWGTSTALILVPE